jgi:hypothetical protein
MAWTLPVRVRADASVLPPGNFKKDTTVRPSHGRPRGHRPTVRPSVIVRVTTLIEVQCLMTTVVLQPATLVLLKWSDHHTTSYS